MIDIISILKLKRFLNTLLGFMIVFGVIFLFVRAYLKTKKVETKRFKIIKTIDDVKIAMLHCKDDMLKQAISIRIKTILKRINDFTVNTLVAGEFWSFLLIGTFSNRQYNLINNELEEHLETLAKIQVQLPKPII
ncbi:hypothetical protein [Candidatus Phytoplasma solani]|uniref:hypothetical protein n=1 Tax=Candidatus Phytoplasma solani TaxID=69896 RepID=UPI0003B7D461|nr:hypothetical protein [Candidatus Phytoplasma solani]CCP88377.1 hypothetical protein S284_04400 [Candidatus Phytoplasma solani]